jgi:glycosyltransferase involved in cell wall biosynthesis
VHGQDWRREKWGPLATMSLRLGEWMALHVPHATISVSSSLAARYRDEGRSRVTYIPNGVKVGDGDDPDYLRGLGLEPRGYMFWAGRLVPEKAVHMLIDAHMALGTKMPLVIAGDTSHSDDYVAELRRKADPDSVRFLGYVYGDELSTLFRNAALFVLPSTLEGQPIVLLEALAYGVPVVASDIPANLEVLDHDALMFRVGDADSLIEVLERALEHLDELLKAAADTRTRTLDEHDWGSVARRTAALYATVARRGRPTEDADSSIGGETA